MGVDNFQYGSDLIGFFVAESTYGTAVKPAAGNAFRATAITMGQPVGREHAGDRRGTRSRIERVTTRTPAQPWSVATLLRPSGSAGTAPDIGDLLKHAFGTETVSGGTSVTYSLLKDPTALSGTLYRQLSDIHEFVYGAVVQSFTMRWTGDGFVICEFSGVGKEFGRTGNDAANGTGAAATALVVDDADFFSVYSIIKIDTDDNSSAGYQVTAIDHSTQTLTITPAATWSDNDTVTPFLPSGTFAGSPLFGTDGSLSLDNGSSTIKHVGGSLTVNTGIDLLNEEYGDSSAADVVVPSMREVSMSLDFLVRKDETHLISEFRRKVQKDIKVTIGSTAGSILTINGNVAELDPQQLSSPDSEMVRYSADVTLLASSSLEDEVDLVFT